MKMATHRGWRGEWGAGKRKGVQMFLHRLYIVVTFEPCKCFIYSKTQLNESNKKINSKIEHTQEHINSNSVSNG